MAKTPSTQAPADMDKSTIDRELISTPEGIRAVAETLKTRDIIAFDTEFIRETTFFPVVEIIQVATDEKTWIIDAQAFKKNFRPGPQGNFDPALKPLLDVFADPKILKIIHAAQADQECLYTSFGMVAVSVLDTSIAASLCGYGDGVGLGKLLQAALEIKIKKGHARTNWSARPLPPELIEYAHADVEHLVALGRKLLAELDGLGRRDWAYELSAKWGDPSLYEPDIEGTTRKLARGGHIDKRGYSALQELVRWREARVRELNLPRRWVADDTVLMDLAHVRPKNMEHLATFRGINKGVLKSSGESILVALKKASECGEIQLPSMPRAEVATPEEGQILDLLKCYIGILADQHRLAAKYIATSAHLLPILRRNVKEPADLVKHGILSEHAARLVGEELIAFTRGHRAFVVKGGKIEIMHV